MSESSSPQVSVYVGASLDGFIARVDGAVDWLESVKPGTEPAGSIGFEDFMGRIDALVMGRNTFDQVLGFGAWPYGNTPVYVATHRPLEVPEGAVVRPVKGTPAEIVATATAAGCPRLYIDGGKVIQEFLAAGIVDELIVSRLPVLIGSGIPLFGAVPSDMVWEHVATWANQSYVQTAYRRFPVQAT